MIRRDIVKITDKYREGFPVLAFTGARQCGKMTLLREHFKGYRYYNLEHLDTRRLFEESPSDFINVRNSRVIIDEVQRLPDPKELETHYLTGSIFENFIIADTQKELMNRKAPDSLFFSVKKRK
jgi:predicted AAA+ superfamily ATPase